GGSANVPDGTGSDGGGVNTSDAGGKTQTLGAENAGNGMFGDVHVTACDGECADVEAVVTGGNAPFSYAWSAPELVGAGPHHVCPVAGTDYTGTVTDSPVTGT